MSRRVGNIDWREVLMNPVFGKRDQIICDCLFCGKSKHMYVNKNTGAWDCKNVAIVVEYINYLQLLISCTC